MSKVIIGAAGMHYDGWISTNMHELNLLRADDWLKYAPVECALAEHVWEHLTPEQGRIAAQNVALHVPRLRVAVPDGYYPDEAYVKRAILGECPGDHNNLYNVDTLQALFESVGYRVYKLEWWSVGGTYCHRPFDDEFGYIQRSLLHDKRNRAGVLGYTSIIIDCVRGR